MRFHSHPGPGVHLPPPVWVIGCMMLGLLLDRLAALPPLPLPALAASLLGGALMLAGSGVIAAGVIRFRRAKTPVEPWKPARALVTEGIYRYTRNPMYLGMALFYSGVAIARASLGAALPLPVVIALIQTRAIQREEMHLLTVFGKDYADYCRRVRRWL
ncbi:MAG: isoprenylcysteine carboxylmethyltransferase family protein [Sphingomonadales bacterium]|nr:MAG: isoprenylcysteine carboxylmethyltransferase family protein [Sphingomonadales bacterium]